MEKWWIHKQTEKTDETWRRKKFVCLLNMNPIKSHARFNFSYTVRRQHPTTEHQHSKYSFEMCTAKLYGHSTDTALSIDTRTNTKYWKVWQLTYNGYQDLQHHWLTLKLLSYIYIYDISSLRVKDLTLILLMWRKW